MHRALILAALSVAAPITVSASPAASHGPLPSPKVSAASRGDVVQIPTDDDLQLAGTYFEPRKGRSPGVLLVHDAGADRSQLDKIASSLHKKGFGVLTVDLRGHGESKTDDIDWSSYDADARSTLWQQAPRDVEAAAGWLLDQKNIHSTNLSLIGYQSGCALVARHAERDENVMSMLLLSPRPEEFGFDVQRTIENVSGLPTCVIDGRNDETARMVQEVNGDHPWIDHLVVSKSSVLDDRKTPGKVGSWLAEVAMPKKGRG